MKQRLPKTVRAVIFDLDDTLVLSTVDYGKFKRLVIDKLVSWGEPQSMYHPTETIVSIVARYEGRMETSGIEPTERRRRLAELDRIMDEVELENVGGTKAIRGAVRVLELLRMRGIKVGILTRGCSRYASAALASAGLSGLVDAVECRNSNSKAKPDPESYLRLVAALGIRRDETFFVGDHPIDAKCAENAGVPFVAVETGDVPKKELEAAGCIVVFKDVGKMEDWFKSFLTSESKK